tara:strand:- start:504 stop:638 length:135 start_codon:yes stop_codon:yes gene_type:complete
MKKAATEATVKLDLAVLYFLPLFNLLQATNQIQKVEIEATVEIV